MMNVFDLELSSRGGIKEYFKNEYRTNWQDEYYLFMDARREEIKKERREKFSRLLSIFKRQSITSIPVDKPLASS